MVSEDSAKTRVTGIFCKNQKWCQNILSVHSLMSWSTGRPKRMVIYWKSCGCSNGVLKRSSIYVNIHPFDHLAFISSSMYAKVSCDESHKLKNTYKVALILSSSHFSLFSLRHQNGCNPLKLISLRPYGGNAAVMFKDNYMYLSPLVIL